MSDQPLVGRNRAAGNIETIARRLDRTRAAIAEAATVAERTVTGLEVWSHPADSAQPRSHSQLNAVLNDLVAERLVELLPIALERLRAAEAQQLAELREAVA